MDAFDLLIPEALKISREAGLEIGENVGLDDPNDTFLYKLKNIKGEIATVVHLAKNGEVTKEIEMSKVFSFGVIRGLAKGYSPEHIIESRRR